MLSHEAVTLPLKLREESRCFCMTFISPSLPLIHFHSPGLGTTPPALHSFPSICFLDATSQ